MVLTLILGGATTILNSTILGSDATGTIAGDDSPYIKATTLQTSTVYGGAGNDTLSFGGSASTGQLIELDVNAFAGADSISASGSYVSSTVNAGSGADTLHIATSSAGSTASTATDFYAGAGADLVSAIDAANVTIYADSSATDTAGGADSLYLGEFTSSTVYGAAGADTPSSMTQTFRAT